MATLDSFQFPPPVDWQAFERLCRDLYCAVWNASHTQLNGRNGQRQYGVDIFGINAATGRYEGVQCKGRDGRYGEALTERELRSAVAEAMSFQPPLQRLIIATSTKRDGRLQEAAREITFQNQASGLFEVVVESWDDILARLSYHEHLARVHLHASFPPPDASGEDMQQVRQSERNTYTVEEIQLQRRYVFNRPIGNARPIRFISGGILALSAVVFIFFAVAPLFGVRTESHPNMIFLPAFMAVCLFAAARANALLKCRFTDSLPPFRQIFFEANENGDVFVTKLDATCPHCGSVMRLRVLGDWRYKTHEFFVCTRNPEQHLIRLDHTSLPPP